MKQPKNEITGMASWGDTFNVWICDEGLKALGNTTHIGSGKEPKTAYKAAARRLRKLANECERKSKK